jgi:hypothetical protein
MQSGYLGGKINMKKNDNKGDRSKVNNDNGETDLLIEIYRMRLKKIVDDETELNDEKVIKISRKLDELLNKR